MKKKDKKLKLNRETIATLEKEQLGKVIGGQEVTTESWYCPIMN